MAAQFDMFSVAAEVTSPLRKRTIPIKPPASSTMSETEMVGHLTNSGRYRILERLVPRAITDAIRQEYPFRGVILDTETTGLNHRKDEIIEIGAISFTFDDQGKIGDVTGVYCGLQQPTVPIPAEITTLTGITDEMVAGQVIDMSALRVLIDPADLVVAHNASFDRPFCEAFSPAFAGKAWACSTRKSTGQRAGSKAPSLDT